MVNPVGNGGMLERAWDGLCNMMTPTAEASTSSRSATNAAFNPTDTSLALATIAPTRELSTKQFADFALVFFAGTLGLAGTVLAKGEAGRLASRTIKKAFSQLQVPSRARPVTTQLNYELLDVLRTTLVKPLPSTKPELEKLEKIILHLCATEYRPVNKDELFWLNNLLTNKLTKVQSALKTIQSAAA